RGYRHTGALLRCPRRRDSTGRAVNVRLGRTATPTDCTSPSVITTIIVGPEDHDDHYCRRERQRAPGRDRSTLPQHRDPGASLTPWAGPVRPPGAGPADLARHHAHRAVAHELPRVPREPPVESALHGARHPGPLGLPRCPHLDRGERDLRHHRAGLLP